MKTISYLRALSLFMMTGWALGSEWDEGLDGILLGEVVGPTETPYPVPNLYQALVLGPIPVESIPDRYLQAALKVHFASEIIRAVLMDAVEKIQGKKLRQLRLNQVPVALLLDMSVQVELFIEQSVASESALQSESQASVSLISEASMSTRSHRTNPTSDSTPVTSESDTPSNSEPGRSKQINTGIIVGASVGGAAIIILIGLALILCMRPRKESAPVVTPSKAPPPPTMRPTRSQPANVLGYSQYTGGSSGIVPRATPTRLYNESRPLDFPPSSGYEVPAWLSQSSDTQRRSLSASTSPSPPPVRMQGVTNQTCPLESPTPPDYMTLEGGTSSQPSNYKAAYRPANPQTSFGASRVASGSSNAGEGKSRFK
ncbi:5999_t:CDS:2 [Acaulospora colombiana]|uniref:5999_t:CDS:1 n=1 Tax=Acaulospora colombiana TaxID=27376 RepID=A0ACA9NAC9_9GLOM|nr:5999_t:CDS:2 [Acaulospora colombiana]